MLFEKRNVTPRQAKQLKKLLSLVDPRSRPNMHALNEVVTRIDSLSLTVKFFGYELARTMAAALPPCETVPVQSTTLGWKPSTQDDIESDWVAHWCWQFKMARIYHRKVWEIAYVMQGIHNHGSLRPGARGLGFGCGREPIPSYLASRGVDVTVTDQPPQAGQDQGWSETAQYATSLDTAFHEYLVERADFDAHVGLRYVDMNAIDNDLVDYDFCWSVCALEHLGSIERGLAFVESSMATVRPGGLSIHTTEFNFANDVETLDNWVTVLFQKRHFEQLADRLRARGHTVTTLDFNVGNKPLDKFIDIPPFLGDLANAQMQAWERDGTPHMKIAIDGFASTCFGLHVQRAA